MLSAQCDLRRSSKTTTPQREEMPFTGCTHAPVAKSRVASALVLWEVWRSVRPRRVKVFCYYLCAYERSVCVFFLYSSVSPFSRVRGLPACLPRYCCSRHHSPWSTSREDSPAGTRASSLCPMNPARTTPPLSLRRWFTAAVHRWVTGDTQQRQQWSRTCKKKNAETPPIT